MTMREPIWNGQKFVIRLSCSFRLDWNFTWQI